MNPKQEQERKIIRARMRKQRKMMSVQSLRVAELNLAKVARQYHKISQANSILSYAPFAGEISPNELIARLVRGQIYEPRITNYRLGQMLCYPATTRHKQNRLGIHEPTVLSQPTPVSRFDIVLVPLVAFDDNGNRLGMGAGFYDRALSFKMNTGGVKRPTLIGLAHHFQQVKSLPAQKWDVPLDAILTDQTLFTLSF